MFSFSKCPFCIKAKKELNDMGIDFTALDLDQMDQEVAFEGISWKRKRMIVSLLNGR